MTILAILATIFGVLGAFALIPQVVKIYKRKSADDISFTSYSIMFCGAIVWFVYGIENGSLPLIVSNLFGGINCMLILVARYKYGDTPLLFKDMKEVEV